MKPIPGLVIFLISFFLADSNLCTGQFLSFQSSQSDTNFISSPKIYAEAHLLFGGEVSNLFDQEKTVITGTPHWKTDVRLGFFQDVTEDISSFISIRDYDYPQTNSFTLYEAVVKADHSWGTMLYGQTRLQAGVSTAHI